MSAPRCATRHEELTAAGRDQLGELGLAAEPQTDRLVVDPEHQRHGVGSVEQAAHPVTRHEIADLVLDMAGELEPADRAQAVEDHRGRHAQGCGVPQSQRAEPVRVDVLERAFELCEPAEDVAALLLARVVDLEQHRAVALDDRWPVRRHGQLIPDGSVNGRSARRSAHRPGHPRRWPRGSHGVLGRRDRIEPPRGLEPARVLAHPRAMSNDEIRHVEANGLRFAYLEAGQGPLVLLLHGFPDSARSWDDARARLAGKGYRAVSPWMRGYAPTAIPPRDADLETLGRDALALIEALGERTAIVVGHDWGAAAAYAAASLDPARVTKLVTIAIPHPAALKPTPGRVWAVRHFIAYKLPGAARRFAAHDFAAMRELYKRWSPTWHPPDAELAPARACFAEPGSLDAAFGYYRQLRFRPQHFLRKPIEVPTIAFVGLDDRLVQPADFRAAARMFSAGYVVEEQRGGHFLHREYPEDFAAKLLAHL